MTDERIIAYLLEELPEEELERFEDECFDRESWPVELQLVEEDLIEAYLRDELTPGQRQHFEQNYLTTPARQERVASTAAFLRHVDDICVASKSDVAAPSKSNVVAPSPEPSLFERLRALWNNLTWVPRAAVGFGVIIVIAGAWFLSRPPRSIAALTLTSSVNTRGEGAQTRTVKLSSDADALKISLLLPERPAPGTRYRVELKDENGGTKPLEIEGQDAQSVSVIIPSAQLARGQYAVKLLDIKTDGTEPRSNSYLFIVE